MLSSLFRDLRKVLEIVKNLNFDCIDMIKDALILCADKLLDFVSAIINRCGFNSEGIVAVAKRLGAQHGKRKLDETTSTSSSSNDDVRHGGKAGPGILGVNIGKNKTSEDASADYVQGVHTLSQYADYLVFFKTCYLFFYWFITV